MSYVPPHKRRQNQNQSRSQAGASQIATTSATAACAASQERNNNNNNHNHNHNTHKIIQNKHLTAKLFCDAFTWIRCINLPNRPDQWNEFLNHFQNRIIDCSGLFDDKVVWFEAVNGKEVVAAYFDNNNGTTTDCDHDTRQSRSQSQSSRIGIDVALEWDTTTNSLWDRHVKPGLRRQMTPGEIGCALSHISLWKELVSSQSSVTAAMATDTAATTAEDEDEDDPGKEQEQESSTTKTSMLIFEDDATFLNQHSIRDGQRKMRMNQQGTAYHNNYTNNNHRDRFLDAFQQAWDLLPHDWDLFYLGFSDRGERKDVRESSSSNSTSNNKKGEQDQNNDSDDLVIQIFTPSYGFHTHAYAITKAAASKILDHHLPCVGPIDVWLADNEWFGLKVYCAVVAHDGWKNTGAPLVYQDRSRTTVGQSCRC